MDFKKVNKQFLLPGLAKGHSIWYAYPREWLSPGGLPGLQNRCRVALRAVVGSTPIHSRLMIGFFRGMTMLPATLTQDKLDALIRRIFSIMDITLGTREQGFLVRYRGKLLTQISSEAAYDQLADALKPHALIPLFRKEQDAHAIIIAPELPKPKPSNPHINLLLFILTFFSVVFAGISYVSGNSLPVDLAGYLGALQTGGFPYAISLIAIMGTHELGHYFTGRYHKVNVTLPYFIPMPFGFGTMGAFISMKGMVKNRNHLLDIGIAGPLAGFIVASIVLVIGLRMSTIDAIPTIFPAGSGIQIEGNSIYYLAMKYFTLGRLLPEPASFNGSPLIYWLKYFFTSRPAPLGGMDVMLSPVAGAGWAGLLVTALNLIPAGTLDGGHVFQVLFGKEKMRKAMPFIAIALVILGFVWSGWWLWVLLINFFGRFQAEPLDQITPLDPNRKLLGLFALILFFLTFVPVPLSLVF